MTDCWIAIADRMPPNNRRVLLWMMYELGDIIQIGSYDDGFGWTSEGRRCQVLPTHWMPLPSPPEVFAP